MDFHLKSLNLPNYKPDRNMAKVIALANQKGGVGILHELNPEEMEGAFQHHLTERNKEKTA